MAIHPIEYRYGTAEMKAVWSEDARLHKLLSVESALENRVYPVPTEIDEEVASLKLDAMGVKIEKLTAEQDK